VKDIKRKTISGIKWLVCVSFLQKVISFGVTIILARLLGPSEFGLFALSMVVVSSFELFKSLGIDSALIQRKNDAEKAAYTAFFIMPFLGLLLYAALFISAPYIGLLLNRTELVGIVRILGFVFVISCLGRIPAVVMEKSINFNKISLIEITSSLTFSATALGCAFAGLKVWSLVYAYILKTTVYTVLVWRYSGWRPKLVFDTKIALEMFHFGKFLLLGGIFWFLKMNLDNLLVGKLLGVAALGLYAVAFNISNFSSDYLGAQIHRVIFPSFSKLQNNVEDVRKATLKTLKYISLFCVPYAVGVYFIGPDFLRMAYGEKWIEAGGALKILAWAGVFNVLPISFGTSLLALGKPKLGFWATFVQVAFFFLFIVPMAQVFGIKGVGIVVSGSSCVAFVLMVFWAMKLLLINIKQLFIALRPALMASFIMSIGIMFLKAVLVSSENHMLIQYHFVVVSLFALIIYLSVIVFLEKELFREFKELII